MRTPLLAGLIAVLIPACTDGLTGVGGDDNMNTGATCGNGAVETGETCDDGNAAAGDGCSASCQTEAGATPKLNASVDKQTITTELFTTHPLTITLSGVGGFGEMVTLAGTVVDAADAPISAWTVTLDNATPIVPMNGMVTAVATLKVSSTNVALAGKVKINVSSSLGVQTLTTDVTALNQVTFTLHVDDNTGLCVLPSVAAAGNAANGIPVSIGTKVRFYNDGTTAFVVHTNNANGITHQGQSPNGLADPSTEGATAYELPLTGTAGSSVSWYCHDPATDPGAANRPQINAVN